MPISTNLRMACLFLLLAGCAQADNWKDPPCAESGEQVEVGGRACAENWAVVTNIKRPTPGNCFIARPGYHLRSLIFQVEELVTGSLTEVADSGRESPLPIPASQLECVAPEYFRVIRCKTTTEGPNDGTKTGVVSSANSTRTTSTTPPPVPQFIELSSAITICVVRDDGFDDRP